MHLRCNKGFRRLKAFSLPDRASQGEDGRSFFAHRWCGEVGGEIAHDAADLLSCSGEVLVRVVDGEAGDFSLSGDDGADGLNARQRHHGFPLAFEQCHDFFFLRGVKLEVVHSAVHDIPAER